MRRNWRTSAAILAVLGAAALIIPANVGAANVANPGPFSLTASGYSFMVVGTTLPPMYLTNRPLAECVDGVNNDDDIFIDAADPQCVPGPNGEPDDSELVPGYQEKIDASIVGTVAADGAVNVPAAGITLPPAYVKFPNVTGVVTARATATKAATGQIDPQTGLATFQISVRLQMTGTLGGVALGSCYIGTIANPIVLNLTTGVSGTLSGVPYNSQTGTATVVDNAFSVPGATNSTGGAGCNGASGLINDIAGLPSPAGANRAYLTGTIDPAPTSGGTTTTTAPTTTTTAPTTTTTAPTTTTTAPTTTTTAPTTTTTAPTTTTTAPTTTTTAPTTTTTAPPTSGDSVSVQLTGSLAYANSGTGTGSITVTRDVFGIVSVRGSLDIPGANGGTATVAVNISRAWILPLWSGQVRITDTGAGVSATTPVLGSVARDVAVDSAKGSTGWFTVGPFPNLVRPYSLTWSVNDAG